MVSHIYRLPTELLLRVVEECYSPSGLHHIALRGRRKRRAWLASTATVSHLWLDIIYPVLYHTIVLHTHRSTRLFLRSLVRNPPIAHHVVRLSFLSARPELNAATGTTRWRLRVARGRLLPLALSLARERYPYTDRDSEPRWLATCYAKIARRCPHVRRCSVAFGHMRGVLGDGAGTNSNNGCACPWTADLEYLHVADIPAATVDLVLPPAPGLRHLTLVWTRPSGPARTLHLLTPAHLAGYAQLEHLDLFGLRVDEAAMRAVLLALKPTLKGLKACSVSVFAGAGHVAPAEWLEAALGDSQGFRELYMCTRRRLWAHTRPLCALQGVRYLTLDLQHLSRYYQREFYPPNVKSVCFVAGSSSRSSANLFPPCVFARYAWRLIARDRDAGCVLQLQTVTIAVPSCCGEETRMWVLLSFLLTAAAQARGLEFKLNLYIMYVSGGDTFRWEPPPRPSAKERVKTVLNRLLRPKV